MSVVNRPTCIHNTIQDSRWNKRDLTKKMYYDLTVRTVRGHNNKYHGKFIVSTFGLAPNSQADAKPEPRCEIDMILTRNWHENDIILRLCNVDSLSIMCKMWFFHGRIMSALLDIMNVTHFSDLSLLLSRLTTLCSEYQTCEKIFRTRLFFLFFFRIITISMSDNIFSFAGKKWVKDLLHLLSH